MHSHKLQPNKIQYEKTSAITLISVLAMSLATLADAYLFRFSTLDLFNHFYPFCLKVGVALTLVFIFCINRSPGI